MKLLNLSIMIREFSSTDFLIFSLITSAIASRITGTVSKKVKRTRIPNLFDLEKDSSSPLNNFASYPADLTAAIN